MSEKLIDITKMSFNEIVTLIANNPELIQRLAIAKEEQDRRTAEKAKREQEEAQHAYESKVYPFIGAVITGIDELRESDYEYSGETVVHTSAGDIYFDGTLGRTELKKDGE